MTEALYAAIQAYAEGHGGAIEYKAAAYPYFFGADGKAMQHGLSLAQGCFQLPVRSERPGAYVHNPKFVIQFLYDSIQDLGGDVSTYTRP
ncbi:MAG: hypothetical protein IPJ47_22990 [Anaerolineales bacterium]|nr:hypothetical protein [Anaerolineales bacterium]